MPDLILGRLEIQNGNGSGTAIVLDGNAKPQTGNITVSDPNPKPAGAGDHFITGQIDIKDQDGNTRLSLIPTADNGGWIQVQQAGRIQLLAADGRRKAIELDAAARRLTLHSGNQGGTILLDAGSGLIDVAQGLRFANGSLRLGTGTGQPGDAGALLLGNGAGDTTIRLDAASASLRIEGAQGEAVAIPGMLHLVDGRLRLGSEPGGGGQDGGLRLLNAAGETVILLDAASASLRIEGAQGETLAIPGMLRLADGHLRLGGEPKGGGQDGSLRLRNAAGEETILLDARTGDILLHNADCAEDFDIATVEDVEPGTVMVLDDDGRLQPNRVPYDRRVAGIVSGAGGYRPGLVLDRQPGDARRLPVALMGKVFCRVDAQYGPVQVGDLLTTSATLGHAMKAADPRRAFGAVLGKALRPLAAGTGLIPVLVSLQ